MLGTGHVFSQSARGSDSGTAQLLAPGAQDQGQGKLDGEHHHRQASGQGHGPGNVLPLGGRSGAQRAPDLDQVAIVVAAAQGDSQSGGRRTPILTGLPGRMRRRPDRGRLRCAAPPSTRPADRSWCSREPAPRLGPGCATDRDGPVSATSWRPKAPRRNRAPAARFEGHGSQMAAVKGELRFNDPALPQLGGNQGDRLSSPVGEHEPLGVNLEGGS